MGFNPRTRVGCDKIPAIRDMLITVSIHAPVWGATWIDNKKLSKEWVSIHAPVWGATAYFFDPPNDVLVSIHAPVWGATLVKIRLLLIFCFNPRTRVGCDQFAHLASTTWRVSIHAPVWGATREISMGYTAELVSIHAPVWGATQAVN